MRVHVACPQAQLQKFLDKMVLPPDMVSTLTGKEVNDAYIGTRPLVFTPCPPIAHTV